MSLQGLGATVTSSPAFDAVLVNYGMSKDPSSTNNFNYFSSMFKMGSHGHSM